MDYPLLFATLMGFAVLIYTITDGYDLGVGISMPFIRKEKQLESIKTIGPFWDANETWLVLGVGVLLAAFPKAHSAILQELYMPILIMLIGLLLRAFFYEISLKIEKSRQTSIYLFSAGSYMAALAQGYMIAQFAAGFKAPVVFACFVSVFLCIAYSWLGSLWLNASLKRDSKEFLFLAKIGAIGTAIALVMVSVTSPLFIDQVFDRWFGTTDFSGAPKILYLWPYPAMTVFFLALSLRIQTRHPWKAFLCAMAVFVLSFLGLAYGIYPYLAPEQMTIYDAAADTETLSLIFVGFCAIMPFILAYTAWSHYIFLKGTIQNELSN